MGKPVELRNTSNNVITGLYEQQATEGDIARYSAISPGYRLIIKVSSMTPSGAGYVTTLARHYQVGNKQLNVYFTTTGTSNTFAKVCEYTEMTGSTPPPGIVPVRYYQEMTSDTVYVQGFAVNDYILFEIPHTATPGDLTNKVVIRDSGDLIAIDIVGEGNGIVWTAPDGKRYIEYMSEGGSKVIREI